MRNPVVVGVLGLAAATLLAAPTALYAGGGGPPDASAQRAEVERLREKIERLWLDVERDHGRVRAADWAKSSFGAAFEGVLAELGTALASAGDDASRDAAVEAALRRIDTEHVEAPLSPTSLHVVLPETARRIRADRAKPRDAFVAAALDVFAAERVEDVWDSKFLALPDVQAFRAAQASAVGGEKDGAAKPAERPAAPPLDDTPVLFDRRSAWVGPWTGWVTDIREKENKRRQVSVKPVYVDRYEVTCAQYAAFVDALPESERKSMLPQGWTIGDDGVAHCPEGRERHPVTGVTWRQAQSYAESLGKRLPSAAEWDRVAAGGEKSARTWPWGDLDAEKTWARLGIEPKGTFPVDRFPDDATPEGVVGLAGNVAELTSTYSDGTEVPRTGPAKSRQVVVCGGSFASRASECTTSWRWVLDADESSPTVGFRCVMDEAEYKKRHK